MSSHPRQPIVRDARGALRWKENAIVRYVANWCAWHNGHLGCAQPKGPNGQMSMRAPDMNNLALLGFSVEDRRQWAQLIGYTTHGYCELSYVESDEAEIAAVDELDNEASICPHCREAYADIDMKDAQPGTLCEECRIEEAHQGLIDAEEFEQSLEADFFDANEFEPGSFNADRP